MAQYIAFQFTSNKCTNVTIAVSIHTGNNQIVHILYSKELGKYIVYVPMEKFYM